MQNPSRACQCGRTSSTRSTRSIVPTSLATSPLLLPWTTDHRDPMRLWRWIRTKTTYTPRFTASQSGEWEFSFVKPSLQRLRPPPVREPQLAPTGRGVASLETCSGPTCFPVFSKRSTTPLSQSPTSFSPLTPPGPTEQNPECRSIGSTWIGTCKFSPHHQVAQNTNDQQHKSPDVWIIPNVLPQTNTVHYQLW